MLQDLDNTLAKLLEAELPDIFGAAAISFDTPDPELIKSKPAVNLFLYDVRENMELRSGVDSFQRQNDGTALRIRSAVRVDCSYLITFWTRDQSNPLDEHRYLGEVMKVLLRYRKLPSGILQGELKGQEPPVRAVSLRPGQLNSMGDFWQAMGGRPKVAINYTVTISIPVADAGEVPLVRERHLGLSQL
jgi:hypothetical protein